VISGVEARLYPLLLWAWYGVAAVSFVYLLVKPAPYGRHGRTGWGPEIPSWLGWILMEAPSPLVLGICFWLAPPPSEHPGAWVFFGLWQAHYLHRAFIQPLTNPGGHKPMPLAICASAIFFNLVNGYLNGRGLTVLGRAYDWSWFADPRALAGLALFAVGFIVNRQSDAILMRLRKPGETGYKIPRGGLYRYVSCPNYFGEIVEWAGFALATWSPAALSFAVWTAANLAPRAVSHHRWYREKFADYPSERRALIPFIV
jgi:protein-S-isoprenylcysteine O-methyltransferase Ste14